MVTSKQWWDKVKMDENLLIDWLKSQYHGERTAALRIKEEFGKFNLSLRQQKLIDKIAAEEELHADWVGELLKARGVTPELLSKKERYWDKTLINMDSVEDVAAIAHHAEGMRLERIKTIVNDTETPKDIKDVFSKILPMEVNHEKWFGALTTRTVIERHANKHAEGVAVLGLVI